MSIPQSYNIATDIVCGRYVSTAMVPTFIGAFGRYVNTYETLIWEWNGNERGGWLHAVYHRNQKEAEKVHGYIAENLRRKESP